MDKDSASISAIEIAIKTYLEKAKENGVKCPTYTYQFDVEIPGWDNPGKFHSVDLWFWFETLAKCWRPFTGKWYDVSRQMCNYLCNFIKNGDPNGNDCDGIPMEKWEPSTADNQKNIVFRV